MNPPRRRSHFSQLLITLGGGAGVLALFALFIQATDFVTGQQNEAASLDLQEEQRVLLEALVTINASEPSDEAELRQKETEIAEIVGTIQALDATISALQAPPALSNDPAITQTRVLPSLGNTPSTTTPEPLELVFYDDFADGLDPAWQVLSGDWITNKGRAMVQSECGTLLIGGPEWNYLVVDLNYTVSGRAGSNFTDTIYFIFSYQNENNYVRLAANNHGNHYWQVIRDGRSIRVPDGEIEGVSRDRPHNLIIEIDGNALRGEVDGEPVYDLYLDTPLDGAVGFGACPQSNPHEVEDYKVLALSP